MSSLLIKAIMSLLAVAAIKELLKYLGIEVDDVLVKLGLAEKDDSTGDATTTA